MGAKSGIIARAQHYLEQSGNKSKVGGGAAITFGGLIAIGGALALLGALSAHTPFSKIGKAITVGGAGTMIGVGVFGVGAGAYLVIRGKRIALKNELQQQSELQRDMRESGQEARTNVQQEAPEAQRGPAAKPATLGAAPGAPYSTHLETHSMPKEGTAAAEQRAAASAERASHSLPTIDEIKHQLGQAYQDFKPDEIHKHAQSILSILENDSTLSVERTGVRSLYQMARHVEQLEALVQKLEVSYRDNQNFDGTRVSKDQWHQEVYDQTWKLIRCTIAFLAGKDFDKIAPQLFEKCNCLVENFNRIHTEQVEPMLRRFKEEEECSREIYNFKSTLISEDYASVTFLPVVKKFFEEEKALIAEKDTDDKLVRAKRAFQLSIESPLGRADYDKRENRQRALEEFLPKFQRFLLDNEEELKAESFKVCKNVNTLVERLGLSKS